MKTKPTNLAEGTLFCQCHNQLLCFYYYCKDQQWMMKIHEIP